MGKLSEKINLSDAVEKALKAQQPEVISDTSGSMNESGTVTVIKGNDIKENSLFAEFLPQKKPEVKEKKPMNLEEFCEYELEQAKLMGKPEPDFDFRNEYFKGQKVYFVRIIESLGEKSVIELVLRTIYPRMMVGSEQKTGCHCIGYNMRDQVFLTQKDAAAYYDSVQITPKYVRSKKSDDDYEEEDDSASSQESLEALMNEKEAENE